VKEKLITPAFNYRDSRWDLVFAICCLAAGIAGLKFTNDSSLWNRVVRRSEKLIAVGTLSWKQGNIRFKPDGSFLWHDFQSGSQDALGGDTVFTGEKGVALLEFLDNLAVEIAPNSLVVVHVPSLERPGLNIKKGSFRLILKRGFTSATISVLDKPVLLTTGTNGGKIKVEIDPENLAEPAKFTNESGGEITIQSLSTKNAPAIALHGNQAITMKTSGAIQTHEIHQEPIKTEPSVAKLVAKPVILKPAVKTPPVATKPVVKPAVVATKAVAIAVEPPKAVEQTKAVVTQEAPKIVKIPEKIEILPSLENSSAQADTRFSQSGTLHEISIILQWSPIPNVLEYDLGVFDSKGGTFLKTTVKEPRLILTLKSLHETEYKYQVGAHLPSGKIISSKLVPIVITLASPVPKLPKNGTIVASGKNIMLTWEKTSLTQQYSLQVSQNKDFSKPVVDEKIGSNIYILKVTSTPGNYYWRVKSHAKEHSSQWCTSSTFTIQ